MLSIVAAGKGVLEVSQKHSGSLFMWSGGSRGFAKNSWGNEYTAVGLFVIAQTLREAWGPEAEHKIQELSHLLQVRAWATKTAASSFLRCNVLKESRLYTTCYSLCHSGYVSS
jgi:hypothetical protein